MKLTIIRVFAVVGLVLAIALALWFQPHTRQQLLGYFIAHTAVEKETVAEMSAAEAAIFTTDDAISFGEDIGFGSEYRLVSTAEKSAVISKDGVLITVLLGDSLIDGELYLSVIVGDAVILNNKGAYLWLGADNGFAPDNLPTQLGSWQDEATRPRLIDKRKDAKALAFAQKYMQLVFANPFSLKKLAQVEMNAEHVREANTFTVYPAEDKQAFTAFGLLAGDQITGINGVPLTGLKGLVAAYNGLAGQKHLAVTLIRQGKPTLIVLPLFHDS